MSYNAVSPSMYDRTFRRLPAHAQLLELYLRTTPHRSSEGLFRLSFAHVVVDLGGDEQKWEGAMRTLTELRPFEYDPDAEIVLDRSALRDNPLKNGRSKTGEVKPDNRIPGAIRKLKALPDTPLLGRLLEVAELYSPPLADAIYDAGLVPPMKALARGSEGAPKGRVENLGEEESRATEDSSDTPEDSWGPSALDGVFGW